MYKIFVDGLTLYDPLLEEYTILSGKVDLEVNKAGSLTFSIPEDNPHYGIAKLMKSIVTLYDDDRIIFKGRPYAPSRNLFRDNEIICEGTLAFFNDSIQAPFDYFGTVDGLFRQVIEAHNAQVDESKRFKIGTINVVNSTEEGNITRSDTDYKTTWEILREKFFESALGGYLWIRYEEDGTYIDYLSDLNFIGNQDVEHKINLIDAKESVSCDELATAIIPLGAKVDDIYTTIESVNNGVKYVYDAEAVEEYGWIFKVVKHDDINDKSLLLKAGKRDLADAIGVLTTIEIKASDLSKAGYDVNPFSFGTYVNVIIDKLNIDRKMLIKKLSFDLLKPESSEITVGDEIKSFSKEFTSVIGGINTNTSMVTQIKTDVEKIKTKKGVASSVVKFYLSTSAINLVGGQWTETPPAWVDGSFYWQKVTTTYTDGEVKESDPICITGPTGATGPKGQDGTGVTILGSYNSESELKSARPTGNAGDSYLVDGDLYVWSETDNEWKNVGNIQGPTGTPGETTYFHIKYSSVANPTTSAQMTETPSKYIGTYVDYTEADSTDPKKYTWSQFIGGDGLTTYLHIKYSNDGGATFTDNNGETVGDYIGQCVDFNETDPTTVSSYKWSKIKGETGLGVKSVTNYYLATASSSGVNTSTSGWTTNIQTISVEKKYLWNYEKITYTDNSTTITTPCIIGTYGNTGPKGDIGKGVASIVEHYAVNDSNTTAPSSWTTSVPVMSATNRYLWNYETITYTDNTVSYTNKRVIGVYGATGDVGQGVESITVEYYLSTSKTTQTGGSWVNTMPTWVNGSYLWIRNKIVYKNPTSTVYTEPYCDSAWEVVNDAKAELEEDYNSKFDGTHDSILELEKSLTRTITENNGVIYDKLAEEYYPKDDVDNKLGEISNTIVRDKESIELQFTNYQKDLEDFKNTSNAEFEERKKLIRFVDGKIILGIEGNELELQLRNDRIYFLQSGSEVAYFSNSKLYVTDIEVLESLIIGKFAFKPRPNGSLDFKKVGE